MSPAANRTSIRRYAPAVQPAARASLQRGRALRYFRVEIRGWTQRELARQAHVGVNTVSRAEVRGVKNDRVYIKIRRALGVSEAEVQRWVAARPLDKRLLPLVVWFEALPAREQDLVAQALLLLLNAGGG